MENYVKYIPNSLLEDLKSQRVIPFIGSGFSKNANYIDDKKMPDWNELGNIIASQIDGYKYERGMAIDALSTYEDMYSRVKLIELLAKHIMIRGVEPGKAHEAFCNLFNDRVCTTNFDDLLERAYERTAKKSSLIVSEEKLGLNIDNYVKLIKIHGDFNHVNNMVITERDYDCFIANNSLMATYISNLFITNTILLIGYSFDDADMRTLWNIINSRLGELKRTGYCLMVDASEVDILRFKRRNIRVINLPGEKKNYPLILQALFEQLKEEIVDNNVINLKTSDPKIKENMLISENSNNRLCYISASYEKSLEIRDAIIPIILNCGYEPAFVNEVLSFGNNIMRKTEVLIRKCGVVLLDISNRNPYTEWESSLAKEAGKKVIYICEKDSNDSIIVEDNVIEYQSMYDATFAKKLEKELKSGRRTSDFEEAKKLMEQNEYTPAVILALRYLEDLMRKKYMCETDSSRGQRLTLGVMLREKSKVLGHKNVFNIINFRNEIIHTNKVVNKEEADKIFEFVNRCIDILELNKIM